jgi:hypothetical protein
MPDSAGGCTMTGVLTEHDPAIAVIGIAKADETGSVETMKSANA